MDQNKWTRLRHYLVLSFYLVIVGVKQESRNYTIGILWWLIEPLFFGIVYFGLFVIIMQTHTLDFVPVLLLGLLTWRWFAQTVSGGGNAILGAASIIRHHDVPKLIFPLQRTIFEVVRYCVALLLFMTALAALGLLHPEHLWFLPIFLGIGFVTLLAMTLILSVLFVFIPDLKKALPLAMRGLFFFSGVFFDASRVPEELRAFYYLNPFATLMEIAKATLLDHEFPPFYACMYLAAFCVLAMLAGLYMQIRFNRKIPRFLI